MKKVVVFIFALLLLVACKKKEKDYRLEAALFQNRPTCDGKVAYAENLFSLSSCHTRP